jgi:hypothetical protein
MSIVYSVCPDCPSGARPIQGCELITTKDRMHMFKCKTCGDGYNLGDSAVPCDEYKIVDGYLVCRCQDVLCSKCTNGFNPADCYVIMSHGWRGYVAHKFSHDSVSMSESQCPQYGIPQQKCHNSDCDNYTKTTHPGAACSVCKDKSSCTHGRCMQRIENSYVGRDFKCCTEHIWPIECIDCKNVFRGHGVLRCAKCIPTGSVECLQCNKVLKYGSLFMPEREMTTCLRCDDWRGNYNHKGTLHELFISTSFRLFESRVKLICANLECDFPRALVICAATLEVTHGAKRGYLRKQMLRNLQENESPLDDESGYACLVLMKHYKLPNDIRLMIIHMYQYDNESVEQMLRRKHRG